MKTRIKRALVHSALLIFAGLLCTSPVQAAQNCVAGTWQSPPNSYWDSTNGSFPIQAESAHFQLRWPADKPNLFTKEEAATALNFFEKLFTWFTSSPINWPEPFCDASTKHKVQIFTNEDYPLTGSGAGERSQAMWVDAWRVKDGSANRGWSRVAMTHEFTHTMQYSTRGMRNTNFGGWFWESHAEFMAHQYPDNDQKVGCTELSAWTPHLYYGTTRHRYCSWQFWSHLKDKYGFTAVNNIWLNTVGQDGQDPFVALMRTQGWSTALLGDEFGQYAMKNVNWDYVDSQDGFNRGASFRAHFGKNTDLRDWRAQLRLAKLDPIDISKRQFVVSKYFAPQRFGYNIVRLIPDAGATNITVNFRGVVQAAMVSGAEVGTSGALQPGTVPNPGSNWRWGVVAIDKNGKSRSSAMQRGAKADLNFAMQTGDQEVYLVVAAAPDVFQPIVWDQRYHTIYRYPYKVQFYGALPDGYQAGYQVATARSYPAGHKHSNGGGWVSETATVDASAYVGPNAAVLGGSVLGNARIEDHAAVWNSTVKDNAVVGGLTQLCDGVTVSGSAQVRSVMACNFDWWKNVIAGTAKLYGDLEVRIDTTPVTSGAFSGILYSDMLSKPEFGSTKTALPVEVTMPIPSGWPEGDQLPLPSDAAECAAEWQTCQMPDSKAYTVYYGADGMYAIRKSVTGSLACNNATFGDPAPGTQKRCYRSANAAVANRCASEAQTCQMPDANKYTVFYGADGKYASRTLVSGSVTCSNATFGDPVPGVAKSCFWLSESSAVTSPANAIPLVSLNAPANNASYMQGSVISFTALASDSDGAIVKVELYDNGNLIGTDSTAPHSWTWSGATAGKHVFTAKATDNLGATATSSGINVNVTVNAPSALPASNAVKCANQNGTCTLPSGKTATVWYGARTSYKVLTGMTGSVACNNSSFGGDPIWYAKKVCYYLSN